MEDSSALAVVPLLMGMVLILVSFEEKTLHNLFSFLLILDAIANFYTILYYRGVARRYGRHSEQILDISNQEATAHEVIDGKIIWYDKKRWKHRFFNSDKGKQRLTKEGCFRCMIAEAY